MLKSQLDTRSYGRHGNALFCPGTRKSGVPNTSCGNTLLALFADLFSLSRQPYIWNILCTGDDMVAFTNYRLTPQEQLDLIDEVRGVELDLGLKVKPLVRTDVRDVGYCSGRFVPCMVETVAGLRSTYKL